MGFKMKLIILFSEDFEILITFVKLLNLKLSKINEDVGFYEWKNKNILAFTFLAKGKNNLPNIIKNFLDKGIVFLEKLVKNNVTEIDKIYIVVLSDKDIEKTLTDYITSLLNSLAKEIKNKLENIDITYKYKMLGEKIDGLIEEFESYFLEIERRKNNDKLDLVLDFIKRQNINKPSIALYTKILIEYGKPYFKVYIEDIIRNSEFREFLAEKIGIKDIINSEENSSS